MRSKWGSRGGSRVVMSSGPYCRVESGSCVIPLSRVKGRDAQHRLSHVETGDEASETLDSNNT